jgi:hypothetical protein
MLAATFALKINESHQNHRILLFVCQVQIATHLFSLEFAFLYLYVQEHFV